MAQGIFTPKQHIQGIQQKSWNTAFASTYAAVFNGSNYILGPASSALNFGTGNFTVECWIYPTALGNNNLLSMIVSNVSSSFQLALGTPAANGLYWYNNAGNQIFVTTPSLIPNLNKWTHIAVVRSGSTVSIYNNGIRVGTTTNSGSLSMSTPYIGILTDASNYPFIGQISNFRVTNTAVYDSTLTWLAVPASPLTAISGTQLLTFQSATIVDNSTNALALTNNGSVSVQPASPFGIQLQTPAIDYLVVAGGGGGGAGYGGGGAGGLLQGSMPITTGSPITVTVGAGAVNAGQDSVLGDIRAFGGAYCVQYGPLTGGSGAGAFNWTGTGSQQQSFSTYGQGNDGGQSLLTSPSGSGGGGAGTKGFTGSSAGAGNGGAGIASVISGTVTIYAGGGGGSAYGVSTNSLGGVGGGGNGGSTGGSGPTNGQANTGGGGGAGGTNSGGSGIVIISYPDIYAGAAATTGGPTVSTSGSGSMLPASTSSWIYYAAQSGFAFGTGDFTIEFWVNFTSTTSGASGTSYLFDFRGASYSSSNSALGIFQNNGGMFLFSQSGLYINAGMPLTNTWLNISVSRTSGTMYYFVNGNLIGSGADSTNYTISSTGPSFMGSGYYINYGLQGYMSNIRVIKGTGLYTSNYTVTTTPYVAVTNTQLLLNNVSGAYLADGSTNAYAASVAGTVNWNQASPIATGLGYKNRVYKYTDSGTITF